MADRKLYNDCMKWREKRPWCGMETALYWVRKQREREVTYKLLDYDSLPHVYSHSHDYDVGRYTLKVMLEPSDQDREDLKFETAYLEHSQTTGNSGQFVYSRRGYNTYNVYRLPYGEDESYEYNRTNLKLGKAESRRRAIESRKSEVSRIEQSRDGSAYDVDVIVWCDELDIHEIETYYNDDPDFDQDVEFFVQTHLYFLLRSNQMKDAA